MAVPYDCPECGKTYIFTDKASAKGAQCDECWCALVPTIQEKKESKTAKSPTLLVFLIVYLAGGLAVGGALLLIRPWETKEEPEPKARPLFQFPPMAEGPGPPMVPFGPPDVWEEAMGGVGPRPQPMFVPPVVEELNPFDPNNSPPQVEWKQKPENCVVGQQVTVVAHATDPDLHKCRTEYRLGESDGWKEAQGGHIEFTVAAESTTLQVRAIDEKGAKSQVNELRLIADANPWLNVRAVHEFQTGQRFKFSTFYLGENDMEIFPTTSERQQSFQSMAWTTDGKSLLGHGGPLMQQWELLADGSTWGFGTAPECSGRGAFTPDGKLFACGTANGRVLLWERGTSGFRLSTPTPDLQRNMQCLAIQPDARLLAVGGMDGMVQFWQLPELTLTRTLNLPGPIYDLAWTPDGKTLNIASHAGLRVLDADANAVRWDYTEQPCHAVRQSPDGKELYALNAESARVNVLQVATGQSLRIVTPIANGDASATPEQLTCIDLSPDGHTLVMGDSSGKIHVHRLVGDRRLALLEQHEKAVTGLAYSPDGKRLASTAADGKVLLWAIEGEKQSLSIRRENKQIQLADLGKPTILSPKTTEGDKPSVAAMSADSNRAAERPAEKTEEVESPKTKTLTDAELAEKKALLKLQLGERFAKVNPAKALGFLSEAIKLAPEGSTVAKDARKLIDEIK